MNIQPAAEEDTYALRLLEKVWEKVRTDQKETKFEEHGFAAARAGNTRFIAELLRNDRDLVLTRDDLNHTIFHIAVIHRHRGIYNLLYEIGEHRNEICQYRAVGGNNMLHLVGLNSTSSSKFMAAKTSGASLLMQRELLWFKVYLFTNIYSNCSTKLNLI